MFAQTPLNSTTFYAQDLANIWKFLVWRPQTLPRPEISYDILCILDVLIRKYCDTYIGAPEQK